MTLTSSVRSGIADAPRNEMRGDRRPSAFTAAGLLVVAFIFVAWFPITNRDGLVQVEQYLLLAYSAVRAGCCVRAKKPRMAMLVAWLFVYTLFGLVQVVQLSKSDNPFHVAAPDSVIQLQLAVILFGCVAMDLTSTLRTTASRVNKPRRKLSLSRTVSVSLVTLLATPLLVARLGGVGTLFSSRTQFGLYLGGGKASVNTGQLVLLSAANVVPFMCAYALVRLRVSGEFTFSRHPELAALLGLLVVINVVFNNPISQPRYWIATMAIAVAIAGRWVARAGFQVFFVAAFVVMSVLVFPYLDVFRYADPGQATIDARSITDIYVNKTDYGTTQDVANTITYVDNRGHTDGRQLLGAALFFVPRSQWSAKPDDTAKLLAVEIGYVNQNLDSPLWSEGYIDFGFLGVALVLAAFGEIAGRADRSFRPKQNGAALVSMLVPVIVGYELIILRGSLLQAMARLAVMLLAAVALSRKDRWLGDRDP